MNPQKMVDACQSLTELRDALNAISAQREDDHINAWLNSNAITELPTFGGDEPSDTQGIYSWDTSSLLVPDEHGGWTIEARDPKTTLTAKEAAEKLDISQDLLRQMVKSKRVTTVKRAGRNFFRLQDIRIWKAVLEFFDGSRFVYATPGTPNHSANFYGDTLICRLSRTDVARSIEVALGWDWDDEEDEVQAAIDAVLSDLQYERP